MALCLGLDAGGTKTECVLADETTELVRRSGATVKLMAVAAPEASLRLATLIGDALAAAGADAGDVGACCIGLAGSSSPEVRAWANSTLQTLLPNAALLVLGDEEVALDAGFQGGPGVLLIAGTGSHVIGRCTDGMRITAGGYGPSVGDEGSGYWIGREGLRAALRARDRGVKSCMIKCISEHWAVSSFGDLIATANKRERPAFGELAPTIARCAEQGDRIANSVLERAGEELADQVAVVLDRMRAAGCRASDCQQLAFVGGIITHIAVVRRALVERLRLTYPELTLQSGPVDSALGAVWRARQLLQAAEASGGRLRGFRA